MYRFKFSILRLYDVETDAMEEPFSVNRRFYDMNHLPQHTTLQLIYSLLMIQQLQYGIHGHSLYFRL